MIIRIVNGLVVFNHLLDKSIKLTFNRAVFPLNTGNRANFVILTLICIQLVLTIVWKLITSLYSHGIMQMWKKSRFNPLWKNPGLARIPSVISVAHAFAGWWVQRVGKRQVCWNISVISDVYQDKSCVTSGPERCPVQCHPVKDKLLGAQSKVRQRLCLAVEEMGCLTDCELSCEDTSWLQDYCHVWVNSRPFSKLQQHFMKRRRLK